MREKAKPLLTAVAFAVLPTLLVWLPFFLRLKTFWSIPLPRDGMAVVVANYDGPLYIVAAKTFYNPEAIKAFFEFPLPVEYYAAHFPLFPALIRIMATFTGYPYALLGMTVTSSVLAIYFFQKLISQFVPKSQVFYLSAVFSILPARWLIVRSVGSPEPLFVATILASVYFFQNKRYVLAGIWGALAAATKSPGILLFAAYLGSIGVPELKKLGTKNFGKWIKLLNFEAWPIILIPFALLIIFLVYKIRLGDFFAYFHSGDNIHLFFPPFQIFNYSAPWVGTFWLEEIIYVYLIAILGFAGLIKRLSEEKNKRKWRVMAWFTGVFVTTIFFVSHRDVGRYALPIVPFVIISFKDIIIKREFKIAMAVISIPIYLFSLAYISQNVMPISNWTPFLR